MLHRTLSILLMSATLALHAGDLVQRKGQVHENAQTAVPVQAQDPYAALLFEEAALNVEILAKEGPVLSHVLCSLTHECLGTHAYDLVKPRAPQFYTRPCCEVTVGDAIEGCALTTPPAFFFAVAPPITAPALLTAIALYAAYGCCFCYSTRHWFAGQARNRLADVQQEMEVIEDARWLQQHPHLREYRRFCD